METTTLTFLLTMLAGVIAFVFAWLSVESSSARVVDDVRYAAAHHIRMATTRNIRVKPAAYPWHVPTQYLPHYAPAIARAKQARADRVAVLS